MRTCTRACPEPGQPGRTRAECWATLRDPCGPAVLRCDTRDELVAAGGRAADADPPGISSAELIGPECCSAWNTDGWKRFSELPSREVSQHCRNAVVPLMGGGRPRSRVGRAAAAETRLTWTPGGANNHLGVSFCRDAQRSDCYMLDALGVGAGRLGFWWRKHGFDEPGLLSWVPGRGPPSEHVPETVIQTEGRLEDGAWADSGGQDIQLNLERAGSGVMRVWLTGAEHAVVEMPLPDDVPFFAVTPHVPVGSINTATAAIIQSQNAKLYPDKSVNPLLMRGENLLQRAGNRIIVTWKPDDARARLGLAMCHDQQQDSCYVLLVFGFNGRLGYAFKRHSFQELGAAGWVAGRPDRVPSSVISSDTSVASWPQGGRLPLQVSVWRGGGRLQVAVADAAPLVLSLPDAYGHLSAAPLDDRGRVDVGGAGGVVEPLASEGDGDCVAAVRAQMLRGQQMIIKWVPRTASNNIGVAFCTEPTQGDCYVLDLFAYRNRRLGYSWRHHSASESGPGAWVPGRIELLPENHIKTGGEKDPGWHGDSPDYLMMVSVTTDGKVTLRADGLDPAHARQLVFPLPEPYTSVAVASAQRSGEYTIMGPCYNGLLHKFSSKLCSLPGVTGLNIDAKELGAAWTLRERSARGQLRSPVMSGMDGSLCVSVQALVLGSARLSVTLESLNGAAAPLHVAEILPQELAARGDWQRVQKTVSLPAAMRSGQVLLVVSSDQEVDGRGLVLVKSVEFCNPHTCGVSRKEVVPLIAYGSVASPGDHPWFAGVYRNDNDEWTSICGGTLVRADVVVSAAHCFYDESTWRLKDKRRFKVSVGKYTRAWDVKEPGEQRSSVLDIVVPQRYRGSKSLYSYDIALLRVRFVVSSIVLPICMDLAGGDVLRDGEMGVVAGWGKTETDEPSTRLQHAAMPFVPFDECVSRIPDSLVKYIQGDKFCAGNINGSTVWEGDSGGGLAFQRGGRWFLRGVVSTGVPSRLTYSAFTDVQHVDHLRLLKAFLSK
ncbi:Clotting factor C [Frankliniella fusca]|uniref:Clotting factor C n=1 Tax=Frankliniella fusca TaxID=407009 RepID=A0AAE1HAC6_9NEOP|nr:Clotting factor C [Frankliniella fusca]